MTRHRYDGQCYCGDPFCDDCCPSCEMRLKLGCCTTCLTAGAYVVNMAADKDQDFGPGIRKMWSNGVVTFDFEDGRLVHGKYWAAYYTSELEPDPVKKALAVAVFKRIESDERT